MSYQLNFGQIMHNEKSFRFCDKLKFSIFPTKKHNVWPIKNVAVAIR